jgi:hypothetical protein
VERDGDAGDVRVPVALRQLLLHARHVHHPRRRRSPLLLSLEATGGRGGGDGLER